MSEIRSTWTVFVLHTVGPYVVVASSATRLAAQPFDSTHLGCPSIVCNVGRLTRNTFDLEAWVTVKQYLQHQCVITAV